MLRRLGTMVLSNLILQVEKTEAQRRRDPKLRVMISVNEVITEFRLPDF